MTSLLTPSSIGIAVGAVGAVTLLLLLRRRSRRQRLPSTSGDKTPKKGAAGHAGNMESGGFFYKLEVANRFENERAFLEQLRVTSDPMSKCTPEFHGVATMEGKRYIKMRSLIEGFDMDSICQMDVKMGVRCFAEKELDSTKPRPDLFEKLLQIGLPLTRSLLTAEELGAKAITKARWMTIRDATSSTKELGFRVDGVVTPVRRRTPFGDLATCRTDGQVVDALRSFLPASRPRACCETVLRRLGEIESSLRRSELFFQSEVIGSSLLFAADKNGKVGVWLLDFGLTCAAEVPGGRLRHDRPWKLGNHEDGYLTGLTNLQRLWRRVLSEL